MNFSIFFASAAEAWQAVPLVSIQLPLMGTVTTFSLWCLSIAVAVLIFGGLQTSHHRNAQVTPSGIESLKKAISGFWNSQTLERVHLKWRLQSHRSLVLGQRYDTEMLEKTNRLPRAWAALSEKSGKTTAVWLRVLFFL